MEIAQGGPEIGTLSINGKILSPSLRFGGPAIYKDGTIYVPVFIRRFCISGFRICKINSETLDIEIIGKMKALIFLDKIEDDLIYFFEDLDRTKSSQYKLPGPDQSHPEPLGGF
jgi:hypothetical protein